MKDAMLGAGALVGLCLTGAGVLAYLYGRNPDGLTDNLGAVAAAHVISALCLVVGIPMLGLCVWGLVR